MRISKERKVQNMVTDLGQQLCHNRQCPMKSKMDIGNMAAEVETLRISCNILNIELIIQGPVYILHLLLLE